MKRPTRSAFDTVLITVVLAALTLAMTGRLSAASEPALIMHSGGSLLSQSLVTDRHLSAVTMEELAVKVAFANELSHRLRTSAADTTIPLALPGALAGGDYSSSAKGALALGSGFASEQGALNPAAKDKSFTTTMGITPVTETPAWVAGLLAIVLLGFSEYRRSGFTGLRPHFRPLL